MKSPSEEDDRRTLYVVPHEGTWIEILMMKKRRTRSTVVPHEGTWIEIVGERTAYAWRSVVPHEGTWIEISALLFPIAPAASFPTRERGLK